MSGVIDAQVAQAFLQALEKIEDGKTTFICTALCTIDSPTHVRNRARAIIRGRLGEGVSSYSVWVRINHPNVFVKMGIEDYRQGRIQWLKSLIEEFSK